LKLLDSIRLRIAKPLLKSVSLTDSKTFFKTFEEWLNIHNTAKNTGYVGSCAHVWALSFAKSNFRVYDTDADNMEWENHPAVNLLKNPFPYFTGWELMYRIATDIIFEGNAYILKLRPQAGRMFSPVTGLYPLQADRIQTYPYNVERIEYYEYNTGNGIVKFEPADIIHIKNPDLKSITKGSPVISRISDVVDVEKMQIQYRKQFYSKAGFMGATFTTSKDMGKDAFDRAYEMLQKKYGGSENVFKVGLFDNDIKPVPTAYSLKDMQITEDRKLNMEEICSAFGVNKLLFGQSENIQRGNADTVLYAFYFITIDPMLSYLGQVFTNQLLNVDYAATDGSTSLYMKPDVLAPKDTQAVYSNYKSALDSGWLAVDEVRTQEGCLL